MRTHFTSDINEISLTEEKWNSIVSKNETNTVFQTYQWFSSWWKVFGGLNKLFFIWVSDGDEVVGFAPLMVSTNDAGKRTLMFIGEGKSDYSDFIIERNKEDVLNRIFDTIHIKSQEWDRIVLNNIPEYSSTCKILKTKNDLYRDRIMTTSNINCPTLIISGNKEGAEKIVNKKNLKRRYNYFNKHGKLTFTIINSVEEGEKYLEMFIEQHIKRWSITRYPSLFLNYKSRIFYMELMKSMMETGWLFFSVVEFNGQPIAFHYGFDYNSKIIWYKPSFDIEYQKRSPGLILIRYLIEYSIHNEKTELDFTLGDEPFKSRFTNHKKKNMTMNIYKGRNELFANLAVYYIKRILKKSTGWS
jgi:CelD/BcsL family acetyltransferase involved in cellulose biosynthesis